MSPKPSDVTGTYSLKGRHTHAVPSERRTDVRDSHADASSRLGQSDGRMKRTQPHAHRTFAISSRCLSSWAAAFVNMCNTFRRVKCHMAIEMSSSSKRVYC